ncbi:MAG: DNA recombination protein RmuC [Bacteroidaceae bacterium]|nr:DNA recombination protein RmuC [Bacteroidaceae bacterium]
MIEIIYMIVGASVGVAIGWLIANSRKKDVESSLMLAQQQLKTEQERAASEAQMLRQQSETEKAALKEQMSSEAKIRQEQFDAQQRAMKEQFGEQLKTVQEQFQNLATKVLDQTTDKLKTQNVESMQTLTNPLRQHIDELQKAIHNTNAETAKQTASLSEQLKSMAEQTTKINETATHLTNVMKGGNKIQGNWGEMTLKNLLESQGLVEGRDFDLQQTITDEHGNLVLNEDSGARMVPDAILHYPNNEDVIIDAKMSIDAYAKYVETDDETQRKMLAREVVKSVREQFKKLSAKEYSRYVKAPRTTVDFVIMYIPYEGALQLALATEPGLWNEAFNKKIFITGQQNLMAILTMIHAAWRQYLQNENEKQVFVMAEELLRRVGAFIKEFDTLKEHIRRASDDCASLEAKYDGRMGIVQKANQLKKLGVKENVKYPIPPEEEDMGVVKELE